MKRALGLVLVAAAVLASWVDRSVAGGQTTCVSRAAAPVPPAYAATVARAHAVVCDQLAGRIADRKSTRLNSSHGYISYAVFCLKKKKNASANLTCRRAPQ